MFEIGQVVTKENYTAAAVWCNKNAAHIQARDGRYVIMSNPEPTEKEVKEARVAELKGLLAASDYKAIKYAEGLISEEEYAELRQQRQAWREEINELENNGQTVAACGQRVTASSGQIAEECASAMTATATAEQLDCHGLRPRNDNLKRRNDDLKDTMTATANDNGQTAVPAAKRDGDGQEQV